MHKQTFMKKLFYLLIVMITAVSCTVKEEKKSTPLEFTDSILLVTVEKIGGASINEALWARKSHREYTNVPLSLEELSGVLWAAAGQNREDGHLTAPSALALYPIQTYAFMEGGVYLYDAKTNTLTRQVEGDHRSVAAMQEFANTASVNIVYIADLSVYEGKNIPVEKVINLCGMDAAGYAENVNLYTAAHGLKSITRGSAKAEEIITLLNLAPTRYIFILAQSVGK